MATILIVEDDRTMRLLTAARLADLYTVICACDGVEVLEYIYKGGIDLIVADIMMHVNTMKKQEKFPKHPEAIRKTLLRFLMRFMKKIQMHRFCTWLILL